MNTETDSQLKEFRDSIDNIDTALVSLLAERFKVTGKVGILKATKKLPSADKSREAEQIARLRNLAESGGLDPDFIESVLNVIIQEVISNHERIREETNK